MKKKHGLSKKSGRIYQLWKSIRYRCYSETSKDYKNYGGRGISMCDEWKDDFKIFYDWAISNGYNEEKTDKGLNILTIDRIDVNGNYEPNNCRFITNAEQAKNKRNSLTKEERYKICPICGKNFRLSKRNGSMTCSYECGVKLRSLNRSEITKDNYKKKCKFCGKEFEDRGGHLKNRLYCSKECKNKSEMKIIEFNGCSMTLDDWAKKIEISSHCLNERIRRGWSLERALFEKKGK